MHTKRYRNLSATVGASVAIALAASTFQPTAQAATSHQNSLNSASSVGKAGTAELSDTQLRQAIHILDQLPAGLKSANPKRTPNYEAHLNAAIRKIESNTAVGTTYVNWFSCGLALAGAVIQYGVPVGKVISWLKDGYKIFGGVKGLLTAIRSGTAAGAIGEDAAETLGGLLGVSDIVHACS